MLRALVLFSALMLSGGSGFAEEDMHSANFVMPGCRNLASEKRDLPDQNLAFKTGLCGGTMTTLAYMGDNCRPEGATNRQAALVVVQYIDARPARMHENFIGLASEALKAAWPCKP
jgi:hypothetical protein